MRAFCVSGVAMKAAPRPCRWPSCGALVSDGSGFCVMHLAAGRKADDARRKSPELRALYRSTRWRKASEAYRSSHPLCECEVCEALQRTMASEVVDHIISSERAPELFWERTNWQAMSGACHRRKTMTEDGGFGRSGGSLYRPAWIPRPACKVVLVCGAPASGKSTYVTRHRRAEDVVVCLDEIAQRISGTGGHDWDRSRWLVPALDERNRMLAALESAPRHITAWVVMTLASVADRAWWKKQVHAEVRVVVADRGICHQRMRARGVGDERLKSIDLWFQRYRPAPGEHEVIGTG